jgi:uncharacterized protein YecT (DUF1311 family)
MTVDRGADFKHMLAVISEGIHRHPMRAFFLALLFAALLPAAARAQASFDCAKAAKPVEHLICGDPQLARLDGAMGRRYAARRQTVPPSQRHDLLTQQLSWLDYRLQLCQVPDSGAIVPDRRQEMVDCLADLYRHRIAQLDPPLVLPPQHAQLKPDDVLGRWFYVASGGEMTLDRAERGQLSLSIETVSGPTYHTCSVAAGDAVLDGDVVHLTIDDDDYSTDPPKPGQCRIAIRFVGDRAMVAAEGAVCRNFCGARGMFEGEYRRSLP